MAEVKIALRAGMAHFIEAYEKSDPLLFASLFADDGVIVSPLTEPIRGITLIEKEIQNIMKKSKVDNWNIISMEIQKSGLMAVELSRFTCTLHPEGRSPVMLTGKYLMVWKKQPTGPWRIQMLMQQTAE